MRGIVFEIKDRKAVLMKNDGCFIRVDSEPYWIVGDVVNVKYSIIQSRKLAVLAACLALIISFAAGGYGIYTAPVALVSIDINPSLEIGLNRFNRVIKTEAHNSESKEILDNIKIKNMLYTDALDVLLEEDFLGDYMDSESYLVVTVQASDQQKQEHLLQNLQYNINYAVHDNVNLECYAVDNETVLAAHEHGVTAGKYLLLMELAEANPDIDIVEYSHCSIEEIKQQVNEHTTDDVHGGENEIESGRHGHRH